MPYGEAIACCVHSANRFGIKPNDKIAVIGCGFMGLICLQLAKLQQPSQIIAVDPLEERLSLSRQYGATAVYKPTTPFGR